jgi:hypothetical protein
VNEQTKRVPSYFFKIQDANDQHAGCLSVCTANASGLPICSF